MAVESEAEMLGIDLDALFKESPMHPSQMFERDRWERAAEVYWATRQLLEPPAEEPVQDSVQTIQDGTKRKVKKPRKLDRYEFTDRQLEIAMGVLNARNNV